MCTFLQEGTYKVASTLYAHITTIPEERSAERPLQQRWWVLLASGGPVRWGCCCLLRAGRPAVEWPQCRCRLAGTGWPTSPGCAGASSRRPPTRAARRTHRTRRSAPGRSQRPATPPPPWRPLAARAGPTATRSHATRPRRARATALPGGAGRGRRRRPPATSRPVRLSQRTPG